MRFAARLTALSLPAILALIVTVAAVQATTIQVEGASGDPGLTLRAQSGGGVEIHYTMTEFGMDPVEIGGRTGQKISLPGVFLPNDAGAPDLPGMGRFIAMPQGAAATVEILASRTQAYQDVVVAPAPVIPHENEDGPLVYEPNPAIYGRDAFYPEQPVRLSEPGKLRGVDMVTLGITPFQYNPVTRELLVYTELDLRISFHGGSGRFGDDRLRSRYWEPILESQLANYRSLPAIDFDRPRGNRNGCDYLILVPDDPDFVAWGDTLRAWRQLQGISTRVVTTTEIGGSSSIIIESYLNDAYTTWDPAPSAFLILADYPGSGLVETGITSPTWNAYCISDNIYADVDGDDLPDMVHGRITARNAGELETMIGKMLAYERQPYTDPGFYDHPIIAGGWQTERWFILCTEIVLGHQLNVLGKNPVREYAIYAGTPGSVWSTATNTSTVVDYFGPNGLGYIPQTPDHLNDWGGNATRINNDINTGAYMLLHRDHGAETGWGEPSYNIGSLSGLSNDMLPFVFSINCLTGKYNYGSQCFAEVFHRMGQGALGLIAASEVSYSFVNDTFIFGLMDGLWPDFMPDYGPYPPATPFTTELRPAFGMANGKYFLQASSWPYNPQNKDETYHLFHHHGDTFLTIYSEVPQALAVSHDATCLIGTDSFGVQADAGAIIALTVDTEIIGVAEATGAPQQVAIIPQTVPGTLRITVTRPNAYRYDETVPVVPPDGPYLTFDACQVLDAAGDDDGILDAGETVGLAITLENVGIDPTTGITAELTSADPSVTITTAQASYPDIPAGGTGTCVDPYVVEVAGDVPDEHAILFTLAASANEGQWDCSFSLPAQAPVLVAGGVHVDDSTGGNGDGGADPGETFLLDLTLGNTGHSQAQDLSGTLSCFHPDVIIHQNQGTCGVVPIGGTGILASFEIEVLPSCPNGTMLPVVVHIDGPAGFTATLDWEVAVGPWTDDCEQDRGWALSAPGDDATSGRWVREDPVGTVYNNQQVQPEDDHTVDPGVVCFVTGNGTPGGAAGANDVDGGKTTLLTPVFELGDAISAVASYWRWYSNDTGNNPGEDWWNVEVTADGVSWASLEHTQASANAWNAHTFELRDYVPLSSQVQLRFIAADEGAGGSLVEAALDDFSLDVVRQTTVDVAPAAVRAHNGFVSLSPNPFNPRLQVVYEVGEKTAVSLRLYDVAGRLVRVLADGAVPGGRHTVALDGSRAAGAALASGVYFLRLETPQILQVRQVTLLK